MATGSTLALQDVYIYNTGAGAFSALEIEDTGVAEVHGIKLLGSAKSANSNGIRIFASGVLNNLNGSEISGFDYAVYAGVHSATELLAESGVYNFIHGNNYGAYAVQHSYVVGQSQCVFGLKMDLTTADVNTTSNTAAEAASFSYVQPY